MHSVVELEKPYLELVATLQNYHMAPKISLFHILLKIHKNEIPLTLFTQDILTIRL